MRLTLRTLLAYLDNTVEPRDAEALRQKLQQSGFATQLVAAIRASIHAKSLSAPAPDSVHPIEEPNMMSEYLDSTLSPEQIAEVERSCLESEVNLAEAAACHQILTMILGKPANPSEAIKSRIYEMVDVGGNVLADFDSRSASAIAGEIGPRAGFSITPQPGPTDHTEISPQGFAPVGGAIDREAETLDADVPSSFNGLSMDSPTPVPPVGVDDSGVFDAPTKLRQQTFATPDAGATLGETEQLAGDRPLRGLERSDFYEGDVRPSRITPWLVSLALAGVLLFAIAQIFQPLMPLMGSRVAQQDEAERVSEAFPEVDPAYDSEPELPSDETPAEDWAEDGPPVPQASASDVDVTDDGSVAGAETGLAAEPMEMLPAPAPDAVLAEPTDLAADSPEPTTSLPAPVPIEAVAEGSMTPNEAGELLPSVEKPETGAMVAASDVGPSDATTSPIAIEPGPADAVMPKPGDDTPDTTPEVAPVAVATFESKDALVGQAMGENAWKLLAAGATIESGATLICGPEYRAGFRLAGDGDPDERSVATIVGPANLQWLDVNSKPVIGLSWGRGMLTSATPDSTLSLVIEGVPIDVSTSRADSVLAFELAHNREIGGNPLIPENHTSTLSLVAVKGDHILTVGGDPVDLSAGQQVSWPIVGSSLGDAKVEAIEAPPSWVDGDVDTGSLESEAASTLLELLRSESSDSLALSLRVALDFRRNEVAALAGKTMLCLGDASSYFGIDGLLSRANQRLYWSGHLDALREMVDRSPNDAMLVRKAIAGNEAMDDADGDVLFRLLVGFSQDQLQAGEDAMLVKALESGSMPVRVLASENLRDITGKTLYFKPEEPVAARRSEVIKKWDVNLRRGQIRWPEAVPTEDEAPAPSETEKTETQ
ncbi:MAG: hypothetical protein AAFX06_17805 [Planctomycetota bacterium]